MYISFSIFKVVNVIYIYNKPYIFYVHIRSLLQADRIYSIEFYISVILSSAAALSRQLIFINCVLFQYFISVRT